jgi:hypothetical protein
MIADEVARLAHAVSSLAPSASSTRIPQTNNAALISFAEIAFKMRLLASCHRRTEAKESVGSSSVRASWGRVEPLEEVFGMALGGSGKARRPRGRSWEHTAAEAVFIAWERNLRRFMAMTSMKIIHPSSSTRKQGIE